VVGQARAKQRLKGALHDAIRLVPEPRQSALRGALGRLHPGRYPVELEPPPAPAGRTIGPPDFVGVGAQKSGTSWWYDLLVRQSGVHNEPGFRKERHYFDRFFQQDMTPEDGRRYAEWFPRPAGTLAGEWTPCYMFHFWAPELLARCAPDARVLVLLRDPVERYRSGLMHHHREGELWTFASADEAFGRGLYGAQLERLLTWFPADQVLVQQYERCRIDTETELRRTLAFIGADPTAPIVGPLDRPVNVTRGDKPDLPEPHRRELVARYAEDLTHLFTLCPHLDTDLWPNVAPVL
jgi:hypothetical protein